MKTYRKLYTFLTVAGILFSGLLYGQERTITGQVTDNQSPLPGATVAVKEYLEIGTSTDLDGNFQLSVPGGTTTLIVSYIGYVTQEINLTANDNYVIVLQEDAAQLDEIVVVGYGVQKKSDLTGSISQIKLDDKTPGAFTTVDQLIAGKTSGIQVINTDGEPGASTNIRIRGTGTIGDNQPLWVVDGFPYVGNPSALLNLNDIESIDVLKGTSAAAIYGARASNGVVIVTTRRGQEGKLQVTYNGYYGLQQNPNTYDMLSVNDYIDLQAAMGNDFSTFRDAPFVDHQEEGLSDMASIQSHDFGVSGGTAKSNYALTANYFRQESSARPGEFERYTLRLNADFNIGKWLKIGESLQIGRNSSFTPRYGNGQVAHWPLVARSAPFFQLFDENGILGYNEVNTITAGQAVATTENIAALGDSRISGFEGSVFNIVGNIYGEITLFKDLKYRLSGGITQLNGNGSSYRTGIIDGRLGPSGGDNDSGFSRNLSRSFTTNLTQTLSYNNTFGKHAVSLLAGYEETTFEFEQVLAAATGLPFPDLRTTGGADSIDPSRESFDQWVIRGWLGRLTYNFDGRYLLTANVRNDESSRFAPGFRSQTFPSFSVGWNVANESFFPATNIISSLKLRGGWGQSGNQFTGNNFAYVASLNLFSSVIIGEDQRAVNTPVPIGLTSSTLTWEVVNQTDFGIDASLFDDRLNFTIEYFNRRTEDILLSVQPPGTSGSGFQEVLINAGEVSNKGFEVLLDYNFTVDQVNFSVGGNLTTLKNNVEALENDDAVIIRAASDQLVDTHISREGDPIGSFYGWVTDGIFQNREEIRSHATQIGAEPGDIRFKDINNDGVINGEDRTVLGKSIPGYYYGFNIDANYKNIDFKAVFLGVGDVQLLNGGRYELERMRNTSNQSVSTLQRWTVENQSNTFPRATATDPNGNARTSDRWIEDGDYFRLRNLQVGYTIPQKHLNNLFNGVVTNLRFYIAGQNLFTITDYSGLDPEITVGSTFNSDLASDAPIVNGNDSGRTPAPRVFQIGIQATL